MLSEDAAYADQLERALYNSLMPHVGLDDRSWFYLCPMLSDGDHPPRNQWGNPATGCCGANAVRFIPSLPSYMFTTSDDGVWVHLYDACRMDWHLPDGSPIGVDVRTRYPWSGRVELRLDVAGTGGVHGAPAYPRLVRWRARGRQRRAGRRSHHPRFISRAAAHLD